MPGVMDIIDRVLKFDKLSMAVIGQINQEIEFQNFLK
jgi:hypothetical protein